MNDFIDYTPLQTSYEYLTKSIDPHNVGHSVEPCVRETRWVKNSNGVPMLHSIDDEPAVLYWSRDGKHLIRQEWYLNGLLGRKDGNPAAVEIEIAPDLYLREEYWDKGFMQPRLNGEPTIICRYEDGGLEMVEYRRSSLLHRDNAPAMTFYDRDGTKLTEHYFREGEHAEPPQQPFADISL